MTPHSTVVLGHGDALASERGMRMKTKGLTRGEILLGMERGVYEEGHFFKEVSAEGIGAVAKIVSDEDNETCLVWEVKEVPLQLRNCLTEKWDVIEKPLEVGEWVCHEENELIGIVTKKDGRYIVLDNMRERNGFSAYWDESLRKATPEEIAREKRRRVFAEAGRELDEFRENDVVEDGNLYFFKRVVKIDGDAVRALSAGVKEWYHKSELIPVYFAENMVREEQ